jgi:hypothetical protein
MNRRKRIVIVSVVVAPLLVWIMATILVNRDGKTLPLVVTFRNENGENLASYVAPFRSVTETYRAWNFRIQRASSRKVKTILRKYRAGTWNSEEIFGPWIKSANGMLQFSIPMPTDAVWKLQVTSIGGTAWKIGNGTTMISPFRQDSQTFESQVFTNASSVMTR